MKIKNLVDKLRNTYFRGAINDDTYITRNVVYDIILPIRASLLANEYEQKHMLPSDVYSTICTKMGYTTKYGCKHLQIEIPDVIVVKGIPLINITYKGSSISFTKDIPVFEESLFSEYRLPEFTYKDGNILISGIEDTKLLSISAVLYDPTNNTGCIENEDCEYYGNKDFKFLDYLTEKLYQYAFKELSIWVSEDRTNNTESQIRK